MSSTAEVLARLRAAADDVRAGWLPEQWLRISGPGPDTLLMRRKTLQNQPYGVLPDLALEPGVELQLDTLLDVPPVLHGVEVSGDPLELTVNSLYPIGLAVDGHRVFDGDREDAAAGPALIELVESLGSDAAGLALRLTPPDNQVPEIDADSIPPWLWLHFTTPRLRRRFEVLDVAWAQLHLADALATTDDERAAVNAAAQLVPEDAHALSDDDAAALAQALQPVAHRAQALTVRLVGHSHIDLAWLWRWQDTVGVVLRDVQTVLSLMDEFPEMHFTHSQPATYDVVRVQRPDLFARIRAHVDAGRWEPATVQWVETDTNLVSGESLARQVLEGVTFTREQLGRSPEVLLAPDTFGHSGNLPQLAAAAGARAYYQMRCNPGGDEPWPAYWWEGDDGSRLLGVWTPDYFGHITAGEAARSAVRAATAGHSVALQLYGVCDHGGGPTRQSLEALRRLQDHVGLPRLCCSTISEYVDELLKSDPVLPVHQGESPLTFTGCYTSHTDTKVLNRRGEEALVTADTLAALAGTGHADDTTQAWRTHLRHQFHDILGGSSIRDVYADQAADAREVEAVARQRTEAALDTLRAGLAAGSVAVTNPHAWDRVDVVTVEGLHPDEPVVLVGPDGATTPGQRTDAGLCFVARVPGFGTVQYDVRPGTATALLVESVPGSRRLRVSTPVQQVEVDERSGAVSAWTREGADLMPRGASYDAVQVVDENPTPMSAWLIGRIRDELVLDDGHTEVVEQGPVRVVLETTCAVRDSHVRRRLSVYSDLARIDVDVQLDWREPGSADVGIPGLKAVFRTGLTDTTATYETPFSAVSRTVVGEVPALRWAALQDATGRGVAVVNSGRHGHDATDGTLRLRLVRSPYEPDGTADVGLHEVRIGIVPLTEGWAAASVPQVAAGFGSPLLGAVVTGGEQLAGHAWPVVVDADPGVLVDGLKPARRGTGTVVRMHETTGHAGSARLHHLPPGSVVHRANVVEDEQQAVPLVDGSAHADLRPYEVLTLVVRSQLT